MLILRKKAWIGIKPINKLKTGFPMAKILVFYHLLVLTVGFLPSIPNLNEFLHHINGLRYPWDYLKMLRYRNLQPKCLAIKSVLVLPEYWGSGVSLMLFSEMIKRAQEKGYTWAVISSLPRITQRHRCCLNGLGESFIKGAGFTRSLYKNKIKRYLHSSRI